ncbi:MAG: phosphate-binding protein, partial [Proteobacteria bacterium]|nr:phosphate-binding protein [Pseudomonadota bacterium]
MRLHLLAGVVAAILVGCDKAEVEDTAASDPYGENDVEEDDGGDGGDGGDG